MGSGDNLYIPVTPGQWYELSVYTSTHRCNGRIFLQWFDESGASISAPWSDFGEDGGPSTNPDAWQRRWMKALAPAGAAFVRPIFRKFGTLSGSNSYLMLHKPMVAEAHAQATGPAPWSPGGQTIISGNMIKTGLVDADRIKIDDVTLDTDGSGNLIVKTNGVGTNQLANNAVTRMAATARASQSLPANAATWVGCMEVSLPMVGGYELFIQVMGQVEIGTDMGGGPAFEWRILVNGTQVWKSGGGSTSMIKTHVATSVAGGSVPVRVEVDTNGTGGFVNLRDMSLCAIEFKK